MRKSVMLSWQRRWTRMLAIASANAFANGLLRPAKAAGAGAFDVLDGPTLELCDLFGGRGDFDAQDPFAGVGGSGEGVGHGPLSNMSLAGARPGSDGDRPLFREGRPRGRGEGGENSSDFNAQDVCGSACAATGVGEGLGAPVCGVCLGDGGGLANASEDELLAERVATAGAAHGKGEV